MLKIDILRYPRDVNIFTPINGRRAVKSRRAIAWAFFGILAINGALALMLDQFRPDLRDPEYKLVSEILHQRVEERPHDKLILFLGSSRVALGIDAGEISEPGTLAYNFGIPGAGPFMMNVNWDRLIEEGIRPDEVVIELMHPFYNSAKGPTLDHAFLDASRLSVQEASTLVGYGNRSAMSLRRMGIARLFPAMRHGRELSEAAGVGRLHAEKQIDLPPIKTDAFGYRALDVPLRLREGMRKLAHQQYDIYYPNFVLAEDPAARLRKLIRKITEMGIKVRLLMTPEGQEFRGMMSPEMKNGVDYFVNSIRIEFDIDVIDARDWMPDSAFYDQHHLLPEGAKDFARKLKSRLR